MPCSRKKACTSVTCCGCMLMTKRLGASRGRLASHSASRSMRTTLNTNKASNPSPHAAEPSLRAAQQHQEACRSECQYEHGRDTAGQHIEAETQVGRLPQDQRR